MNQSVKTVRMWSVPVLALTTVWIISCGGDNKKITSALPMPYSPNRYSMLGGSLEDSIPGKPLSQSSSYLRAYREMKTDLQGARQLKLQSQFVTDYVIESGYEGQVLKRLGDPVPLPQSDKAQNNVFTMKDEPIRDSSGISIKNGDFALRLFPAKTPQLLFVKRIDDFNLNLESTEDVALFRGAESTAAPKAMGDTGSVHSANSGTIHILKVYHRTTPLMLQWFEIESPDMESKASGPSGSEQSFVRITQRNLVWSGSSTSPAPGATVAPGITAPTAPQSPASSGSQPPALPVGPPGPTSDNKSPVF